MTDAKRIKYPRTLHLPWSPGLTRDDRVMPDTSALETADLVVTVKMDGENTTLYRDYVHARSLDYEPHPSRSRLKALHAEVGPAIPEGWRVCGENVYARHSIAYENLRSHFFLFSIWDQYNVCLSWDDTCEWAAMLNLCLVTELYRGRWEGVRDMPVPETVDGDPCEGYVVRVARAFRYDDFRTYVGKYVRANHVTTDEHWMRAPVIPNRVRE